MLKQFEPLPEKFLRYRSEILSTLPQGEGLGSKAPIAAMPASGMFFS